MRPDDYRLLAAGDSSLVIELDARIDPELNALFRDRSHKNYRVCGDQLLRNFLRGLTQRVRPEGEGG